jgi:AcrR family transcriptional regulator
MTTENGRERMLARLVAHVREHGLSPDVSLRQLANELGTSHRMLVYYFGSRDGLLATVLTALRAHDKQMLSTTAATWSLRDAALAMWSYYTDPAQISAHRAFFYVFSLALQQPASYEAFIASLDNWVEITTELGIAEGLDAPAASRRAQLLVSAIRGLLMDRLTSSDRKRVDDAFHLLVDALLPERRPARTKARR